jgi:asparagine synthase (glutamine-hydrolysing)
MSGIAGILAFDGAPVDPGRIESMTQAMAHRGPDGIHHWRSTSVALGHCLLHTTAESMEERQPLSNDDGQVVLTMDGRLDNWEELRRELLGAGAVLRTRSDGELVLRAYEAWGRECLAHLDGDFAFALWDARRQVVFCARDRMGRKPFNYHWDGTRLTFASELHAILAMPWVPRTLNEGAVAECLAMAWRSREDTPWVGVRRLVAAHWMEIGPGHQQITEYWRPELHTPIVYARDEEYVEHYRHLLADAVRRTSRTHRPLACEVSGGLDSSAIFAVAADLERSKRLPAPSLAGFTLRFQGGEADERAYAGDVAAHVGLPVHEIEPTRKPLSWYEAWAEKYQELPGYPNGVMGWGIRRAASEQGARALLVGIGGDEWLAGSRDYHAEALAAREWRHLYRALSVDLRDYGLSDTSAWFARSSALVLLPERAIARLRARRQYGTSSAPGHEDWLTSAFRDVLRERTAADVHPTDITRFPRAGQAALHRTLLGAYNVLARESEERLAASLGVELRLPLFTTAIVQFAFSTPERLRRRGHTIKALHRRAMRTMLPQRVLERASKADFMVTFALHVDELRGFLTADRRRALQDWVRRQDLDAFCNRYGEPTSNSVVEWKLWSLFGWSLLRIGTNCEDGPSPAPDCDRSTMEPGP